MLTKQRQMDKQEEIKNLIISTAKGIVAKEGIAGLSIRKITNVIGYSPAIVYHYFRDKDEIIEHLLKDDYAKIISSLSVIKDTEQDPLLRLKNSAYNFINTALQMPDEYMNIMLSSSPNVLPFTSVLFEGASQKRQALGMLCGILKEAYSSFKHDDETIELAAQAVWAATFGLIIRLIIEKNIPEQQRNKLIANQIQITLNGVDITLKSHNKEGDIS